MQLTPKLKGAGLAIMLVSLLFGITSCSNKKAEQQLGLQLRMISPTDFETSKQIVATSAPSAGQSTIEVEQAVGYLHMDITGSNAQYSMKRSYTAEYVERLNGWMVYDDDGTLYRFTAGNTTGAEMKKQTFDLGAVASPVSDSDRFKVLSVTVGTVAPDATNRTLVVVRRHAHPEKYDNLTYTVRSEMPAERVELQSAWMAWVDGSLYRLDQSGSLQLLTEKPLATVGTQDKVMAASDRPISKQNNVAAGAVSADGKTRQLIVTRDYNHEDTYQHLHYTLQTTATADFVAEQKAFMAMIDYSLYSTSPEGNVTRLTKKPVVDLGTRTAQLDKNDYRASADVIPSALSANKQAIVVTIKRTYNHDEKYQTKQYRMDGKGEAAYSDKIMDWSLEVDGRTYVITFPGDTPKVDRWVVVVKAPTGFQRPQVAAAPAPAANGAAPAKAAASTPSAAPAAAAAVKKP